MDRNPRTENFPKAKIEEPNLNLRLPKDLFQKRDDDLCYVKIFGFLKNLVNFSTDFSLDASGGKLDRKVYRIRNKELVMVFGDDYEGMSEIYKVSNATIGILSDTECNHVKHSFVDLVGSIEEVKTAEERILDEVLKTYSSLNFPVILMPPIVYGNQINIPLHKVGCVLGNYSNNLLRMEMESGAWIKIEPGSSSLGLEWRVVSIFGPQENINKAKSLIQLIISEGFRDLFVVDSCRMRDYLSSLSVSEGLNELVQQLEEERKEDHVEEESEDKCYGLNLVM